MMSRWSGCLFINIERITCPDRTKFNTALSSALNNTHGKCEDKQFLRYAGQPTDVSELFYRLLTVADPGGELAEGVDIWVVAFVFKQMEAFINEGLQHGHPRLGARLGPLRHLDLPVNRQRGQSFLPLYWLRGEERRKPKQSVEVTAKSGELKYPLCCESEM